MEVRLKGCGVGWGLVALIQDYEVWIQALPQGIIGLCPVLRQRSTSLKLKLAILVLRLGVTLKCTSFPSRGNRNTPRLAH